MVAVMWRGIALGAAVAGAFGCAAPPRVPSTTPLESRPGATVDPGARGTPRSSEEWQRLLESIGPSPPAAPTAPTSVADAPSPYVPPVDPWPLPPDNAYLVWTFQAPLLGGVAEVCHELLGAAEARPDARCELVRLHVAFRGDRQYRELRELRVFDGEARYSTLVVVGPRGVARVPLSWNVDDPTDPGCPSIVRPLALEQARVENGHLVLVALGVTAGWAEPLGDDDPGMRDLLVREVAVAKWVGDELVLRHYPQFAGPELGTKLRPTFDSHLPWEVLPWSGRQEFVVLADGTLQVAHTAP